MRGHSKGRVLLVDDEPNAVRVLSAILRAENYELFEALDVDQAIRLIGAKEMDVVITDVKMPGKDGLQFFDYLMKYDQDIPVIFLTAYGSVESAVHTLWNGAFYYFIKPPDYERLKYILDKAMKQRRLKKNKTCRIQAPATEDKSRRILTRNAGMKKLLGTINAVKDSAGSVLVSGETGTGKELIARALHYGSHRAGNPFVAVNCAAIPKDLMEAELFGYERGAFTGAVSRRAGKFEQASGGTVFLDEIGELQPSLQSKLLRVLQEKEVERLGGNKKIPVNFRLVSSTNRNLPREILNGNFREDLFYRINVVCINVPPLRERADDIPLLAVEFAGEFCSGENKKTVISKEVMDRLVTYHWPGNVRQLRNIIERAVILAKGKLITMDELPEELLATRTQVSDKGSFKTLRELELETVRLVLDQCKGNKSRAADILGISRKALYNKLKICATI